MPTIPALQKECDVVHNEGIWPQTIVDVARVLSMPSVMRTAFPTMPESMIVDLMAEKKAIAYENRADWVIIDLPT